MAENFDEHVRQQLPFYDLVSEAIVNISRHYLPNFGIVYDIGAGTGNIARRMERLLSDRNANLIPVDSSEEMRRLYKGPGEENFLCQKAELLTINPCHVIICNLTLMFLPVAFRQRFVEHALKQLRPGGVMIVVDKIAPSGGYEGIVLHRTVTAAKLSAGMSPQDIVDKDLSLAGVQRPIDPKILGPDAIQWFQYGDFTGYIIPKSEISKERSFAQRMIDH